MNEIYVLISREDHTIRGAYSDLKTTERWRKSAPVACSTYAVAWHHQLRPGLAHFRVVVDLATGRHVHLLRPCIPTIFADRPGAYHDDFIFECWATDGYDAMAQTERARKDYLAQQKAKGA